MKSTTSNYCLIALAVTGWGAGAAGCRGNKSADPPVHPNLNMDFLQYYKPQESNPWFTDKRAVRPLPAGTVSYEPPATTSAASPSIRGDDAYSLGRGPDGRFTDGLPAGMKLDDTLLARGEERYGIFCTPCHEKSGYGQGIIVQRGLKVPPPSYHIPRLQAMPVGYFYDVITNGKNTMKPYASQVPLADRWAIAAWVRVLQVSQSAELADVPDSERANINAKTPERGTP